ncbi:MAG TPA: VOC family protein [Anaerolineaceae bacterium]|nr:VOC family protein [Anaerolineaceae bacterium]
MKKVMPFLMFQGEAKAALEYYKTLSPDVKVLDYLEFSAEEPNPGQVKMARLSLKAQEVLVNDSPIEHGFTFTPSFSFFLYCESADELREILKKLADGGKVLMPADNYGFSELFAWVEDRFGVSWQLNLAEVSWNY